MWELRILHGFIFRFFSSSYLATTRRGANCNSRSIVSQKKDESKRFDTRAFFGPSRLALPQGKRITMHYLGVDMHATRAVSRNHGTCDALGFRYRRACDSFPDSANHRRETVHQLFFADSVPRNKTPHPHPQKQKNPPPFRGTRFLQPFFWLQNAASCWLQQAQEVQERAIDEPLSPF